jgi:8-amino-7-oxononanoate synthase
VQRHGLQAIVSDSPIQPIMCGDDASAMAMSSALQSAGYLVTAIRPPTVPEGKARLRVTLSALHMAAEVDALVEALARSRDAVQRVRGAA